MSLVKKPARRHRHSVRMDDSVTRSGAPRCLNDRASRATSPASSKRLAADRRGVAAVEYALLASLIALAMVGALASLGVTVGDYFAEIAAAAESAMQSSLRD